MRRFPATVAALALAGGGAGAVMLPAAAAAAHPGHPAHPAHPAHSHACALRDVGYRDAGTLTSWGLTENADGTWSGTLSVAVNHANKHARAAMGTTVTYTITDARVKFGTHATNPPAVGSRIDLRGRAFALTRKCTGTGAPLTESFAIARIHVHAPQPVGTQSS